MNDSEGLRDQLARQGEDALGQARPGPAREPARQRRDLARLRGAREGRAGAGGRDGRAQHPVGGRHRAPDAPPALGLQRLEGIEDGVDRLDQRLEALDRPALSGAEERLAAIEDQLAKLAARGRRARRRARPRPAPLPREQERLEVDDAERRSRSRSRKAKPAARKAKREQPRRVAGAGERRERGVAELAARRLERLVADALRASPASRSLTASTQRRGHAAQARDGEQRRRLHLDRERAGGGPAPRRAPGRGRRRGRSRRRRRRRPARDAPSAAVSPGSAAARSPAPSARLVPSSHSAAAGDEQSPSRGPPASAPHVPTRTSRRAPSSISSSTTIAALGPPMPVLWIVSGAPSAAVPV